MISTLCYAVGLLCRGLALLMAMRILYLNRSWRFILIALGVTWIMLQPVLQFFFSSSPYITEIQQPGVFLLTSLIAAFVVFQLIRILEINVQYSQEQSSFTETKAQRQATLFKLASNPGQNLIDGLDNIIRASAGELSLERVGIWLYNDERTGVKAAALFDQGVISHDPHSLLSVDYPTYFSALDNNGWVVAYDARTHPDTRELTTPYLLDAGVYSMLDVPIRLDGKVIGIICHEETRNYRHWSEEDQEFAHSLADLCALHIAEDQRQDIETKLRESQRHLKNAQNAGQFASFRWEPMSDELICLGKVSEAIGFREGSQVNTRETIVKNLTTQAGEKLVKNLTTAFAQQEAFRFRVQTTKDMGSRHFELRAGFSPETTSQPAVFEGTIQDITDQILVEKEKQRLEGQLIQSQKMESIGTMAGGIAHDFNNILTPILGYTDVALSEIPEDSPLRIPLNEILNSSLRAKDLVEQILLFGRRFDENLEAVDMEQMIQNALRLVRHTLPASVKIDVDIEPNHQLVIADKTQMVQVVVNLCTNAWHAMEPDGGHLIVGLKPATKDGFAMTKLTVTDTGVGMSQDALTRIFEPFYTTKAVGEGTGLGLSMVHGIISKLGGSIEVDSQLGQGSSFQIYLPVTDQQPVEVEDPETTTFSESASILVVDDDEAVAGILKSMLTDLGYETEVHLDGKSALDNFRLHPAQYDMVMTDLTMPDISGVELCDQIRQIEPQIPVFILTGYSKDMVHDQLANRDRCHVVGKPLVRADLAAALAKELH